MNEDFPTAPARVHAGLLLAACTALLGACLAAPAAPQPGTCFDGVKSAGETDVDCGGVCPPCADGKACLAATDCASAVCSGGTCAAATCADGVRNGGESDVDCGGPCAPCTDGRTCLLASDCTSSVCRGGTCAAPTCADGVRNGLEAGVDCGGPICPACGSGVGCSSGTSCAWGVCIAGACDCGDATGVYVAAASGADTNPGTAAAPLKTIQAAVACAHQVPRPIRVAQGVYVSTAANPVVLRDGKSLVGGWSADFAQRSPATFPTEIDDTTDTGPATGYGSSVALTVSSTSAATVLDGFTIQATTLGSGLRATAISVAPGLAGATVRNNVLRCGGNPGILLSRCVDLGTAGASVVLVDNAIHLGASDPKSGTSWGVQGYGISSVQIARNSFDGGSSFAIVPIELWVAPGASPVVEANDVRPAAGTDAAVRIGLMSGAAAVAIRNNVVVVSGKAIGIDDGSGAEISNDTVVGGTGTGIRVSGAGAAIRNDAVQMGAGGTCLAATGVTADPRFIQNDDLWGCGTLFTDGTTTAATLAALASVAGASGNLSADPLLVPSSGYRPGAGSPLLGAGQDLSTLFQTDKAGAIRAPPWSIGAYQGP